MPEPCNGLSAGLWIHDELDKSTPISVDIEALNKALITNGCAGHLRGRPEGALGTSRRDHGGNL